MPRLENHSSIIDNKHCSKILSVEAMFVIYLEQSVTVSHLPQLRASHKFLGTRKHGHLFQENKGYLGIVLKEPGITLPLSAIRSEYFSETGEDAKFSRDTGNMFPWNIAVDGMFDR